MKIKYNLNFKLEQRKDKQSDTLIIKNVPINMELTYLGTRLYYYVGYRIDANKWIDTVFDSTGEKTKIQKVKKNATNKDGIQYNVINNRLDEIKTAIEVIFTRARANNIEVDNEYIRLQLLKELGEEKIKNTSNTLFWNKWNEFLTTH